VTLLHQFAAIHNFTVEGSQVKGLNGYICERVSNGECVPFGTGKTEPGEPILVYSVVGLPEIAFRSHHESYYYSEVAAIRAAGLRVPSDFASWDSAAQDGKITVRGNQVLRWQDGKAELVYRAKDKKQALEQAAFVRKAFKELDKELETA
jgi:hypothetical protein